MRCFCRLCSSSGDPYSRMITDWLGVVRWPFLESMRGIMIGRLIVLAFGVVALGLIRPQPASGAITPANDTYVLAAVSYLDNGRPFGITDFGLRTGRRFCENQKSVLIARWRREGAEAAGTHGVRFVEQAYSVRLFCVLEADYGDPAFRRALMSTDLKD